ncbi:hypothetical protein PMAYCL1PPCAC_27107, partial [Pristionchus mayeri]
FSDDRDSDDDIAFVKDFQARSSSLSHGKRVRLSEEERRVRKREANVRYLAKYPHKKEEFAQRQRAMQRAVAAANRNANIQEYSSTSSHSIFDPRQTAQPVGRSKSFTSQRVAYIWSMPDLPAALLADDDDATPNHSDQVIQTLPSS